MTLSEMRGKRVHIRFASGREVAGEVVLVSPGTGMIVLKDTGAGPVVQVCLAAVETITVLTEKGNRNG